MELRIEVKRFAEEMEKRLRENEDKSKWENSPVSVLERGVYRNYREVCEVWPSTLHPAKYLKSCVDIACYAMMLADRWGDLMGGGKDGQ